MYHVILFFFIFLNGAIAMPLMQEIPLAIINCVSKEIKDFPVKKSLDSRYITDTHKEKKRWQLEQFALKRGITAETAKIARTLNFTKEIAQKEVNQPEYIFTFNEYWNRTMPQSKLLAAKKFLKENYSALSKIENQYKVEKEIIVTLLLVETYFGKIQGKENILDALFTLSLTSYRPEFWEKELLTVLHLIDQKNTLYNRNTKGSWAGAVGMMQFIPSSFQNFAKDGDGDGQIDTLNNKMDAFASAANYLKKHGWQYKKPFLKKINKNFTQKELCKHAGRPFKKGILLVPDKKTGSPAFIVYDNYSVMLAWNKSLFFATEVGLVFNELKNAG